jgi:hypothetical protein
MRNSPSVDAVLGLSVAFIGDAGSEEPVKEMHGHDVLRPFLHRLEVLQAAMNRVAELKREAT